jgi:hypothetical protein
LLKNFEEILTHLEKHITFANLIGWRDSNNHI